MTSGDGDSDTHRPPGAHAAPSPPIADAHDPRSLNRRWLFIRYVALDLAALARRGLRSFRLRGVGPTLRMARLRLLPPRRRPGFLELYPGELPETFAMPAAATPLASIVVPVYGQLELTLRCLHALARSGDAAAMEVIVMDDASPDAGMDRLAAIPGLRYHRNARNLGFIGACNAGAELARGDYVVFLNNDTIAQPGWLDALLSTFARHPATGLAGSKLVYPDGRLQEAGGIVYSSGEPANYGRFEDPAEPRFNHVRRVDYCSGAAIALRRDLFARLGGFDPLYAPAYFEDTDIAMRVRASGLEVRYQPASVVVHLEGATSGTDLTRGVKAHQVTNQRSFQARWRETLERAHPEHDPLDRHFVAADAAARHLDRRHILVLDSYTPTPDRDSGSVRMVELLTLLEQAGCGVAFFAQNLAHDGPYTLELQQRGIEVWWAPWIRGLASWLERHGPRFDAIIVSRHYILSPLVDMLRALAPQARLVFDTVDLHFLREEREAAQSGNAEALRTAQRTRATELALVRACDTTWVVSPVEQQLLRSLVPGADVRIVSNIHPVRDDPPGRDGRAGLVFVGGFRHPPNVDAVLWFVRAILPRLRAQVPSLELSIVGAEAPPEVLALAGEPGVVLLGHVPALEPLLDRCLASIAPLRFGAGIKGKLNQSLARGLPTVATSCAVEGMFLRDGEDVLVADTEADFAAAVLRLLEDPALWGRLQAAGLENTRRHFSRDSARAVLLPWLEELPGP
jgi:GT2 family glycosyltransferase/glycosyltransferase involved in cell wall biosynthesis